MQTAVLLQTRPAATAKARAAVVPSPPGRVLSLERARQRKLVAQFGPLVERLVGRALAKARYYCEADELRSAGYLGLLEAAQRYDASRSIPFEAFAQHRIQGAILDEMRSRDSLARPVRQRARAVETARARLVRTLRREPTELELAAATGEDLETFRTRSARERSQAVVALEDVGPSGWEEHIAANEKGALELLSDHERRVRLEAAIAALPERLQGIIKAYYEDDRSYREIGAELGVSESRVCQLLKGAQRVLRERLESACG